MGNIESKSSKKKWVQFAWYNEAGNTLNIRVLKWYYRKIAFKNILKCIYNKYACLLYKIECVSHVWFLLIIYSTR